MNASERALTAACVAIVLHCGVASAPAQTAASADTTANATTTTTTATTAAAVDTSATRTFLASEVVVTASRYDNEVHLSHTNLSQGEIERQQTARDIPMLLENLPGVYSYSDAGNGIGYTYLKIRGFDQTRVGVLVNGIPLNDPEDHQVYWVDLPDLASSLEDIQVQRGVTNSLGGLNSLGGTVNMVTQLLEDRPSGRATIEAGSYGTNRRMLRYQTGRLGKHFSTGLRISQLESQGYRERSGSSQWGVFWSGRYETERQSLQLNFYTGHELTHHAWWAIDEETRRTNRRYNPETYWNAVDDFRQPHYELHHELDLGEHFLLKNSLYYIHGEGYYENFKDEQLAASYSLDLFLGLDPDDEVNLVRQKWVQKDQVGWVPSLLWEHPGGRLVVGGDVYGFESKHYGKVMIVEGFTPDDMVGGLQYYEYGGDKVAWSAYANERLNLLRNLTLMVDLQWQQRHYDFAQRPLGNFQGDLLNAYTLTYNWFNPRGALFWQVAGSGGGTGVGLYGNVGVAHREPANNEMWGAFAGPDDLGVEPLFRTSREVRDSSGQVQYLDWTDPVVTQEQVINYEAGIALNSNRLSLTLNGYWMDFKDEIVNTGIWDPDRGTIRTNAELTYHRGIELGLRAQLLRRHFLTVAGSRSWDQFEKFLYPTVDENFDPIVEDYSGNPIALFPNYLASVSWLAGWGALDSDLRGRFVGRQHLDNSGNSSRTIAPYWTLDFSLAWNLGRTSGLESLDGMTMVFRGLNLLDAEYETWGYYDPWGAGNYKLPAATRNFLISVNYDF